MLKDLLAESAKQFEKLLDFLIPEGIDILATDGDSRSGKERAKAFFSSQISSAFALGEQSGKECYCKRAGNKECCFACRKIKTCLCLAPKNGDIGKVKSAEEILRLKYPFGLRSMISKDSVGNVDQTDFILTLIFNCEQKGLKEGEKSGIKKAVEVVKEFGLFKYPKSLTPSEGDREKDSLLTEGFNIATDDHNQKITELLSTLQSNLTTKKD